MKRKKASTGPPNRSRLLIEISEAKEGCKLWN